MGPATTYSTPTNMTDDDYRSEHTGDFYDRLFLELFTAVCLVSAVANIIIIFVVVKFKKVRREPTNVILAHLSLLEILYLLATPLTIRIVNFVSTSYYDNLNYELVCVAFENEFFLTIGICLLLFLLVSDWYLKTYNETRYAKFCRIYKYFLIAIYLWVMLLSVVGSTFCFVHLILSMPMAITVLVMLVFYGILFIFLIVMNIVHAIKKRRLTENKHNVGLFVANMFFVLWIPIIIIMILLMFVRIRFIPELPIVATSMGFTSPVATFLYLFYYVDTFNVFFKKVFKCQCNEYENELLEEQTVSYNDTNGVKI